jgi:peroxiredoxin Q/BCP
MVEQGDTAPDFDLAADDGGRVRLQDLSGRRVVIYFYPKDDTPGCTTQACDLRDSRPRFASLDAVVLGISPDSTDSHVRFREKFDLNFPLLSDPDHAVAQAYGVWKEKTNYGRKYWGIERSTFVIDAQGRIELAWRKVSPKGHAERVAAYLEE